MKTIIGLTVGAALIFTLSTPVMADNSDVPNNVNVPETFHALKNMSSTEQGVQAPMTGTQLDAVKGMAGICVSCLNENTESLLQKLALRGQFSRDADDVTAGSDRFVIGASPVDQVRGKMVSRVLTDQTFSPSREQVTVVQIQALVVQSQSQGQGSRSAQQIIAVTQQSVNQALNQSLLQLPNLPQGANLAQQIIAETQQRVNQILNNINVPGAGVPF